MNESSENDPGIFDYPVASTSVRITRREYMRLISQLDSAAKPTIPASSPYNRRAQNRIPFHREARLLCELAPGHDRPAQYLVRCRNICKRGLAFLHEARLDAGMRCEFTLIGAAHSTHEITGQITRSRPIAESVYEIGVRFDYQVDLSLLVTSRSVDGIIPLPVSYNELRSRAAV